MEIQKLNQPEIINALTETFGREMAKQGDVVAYSVKELIDVMAKFVAYNMSVLIAVNDKQTGQKTSDDRLDLIQAELEASLIAGARAFRSMMNYTEQEHVKKH